MIFRIPFDRINWEDQRLPHWHLPTHTHGVPLYIWRFGLDWFQVSFFFFMVFATGMSITLGYHRSFRTLLQSALVG